MSHRWNKAAHIRKEQIESGKDITFNKVFLPYYKNLVKNTKPRSLLEVGCGTGHLSLCLSKHVGISLALDPALNMYETAKKVLENSNTSVIHCSLEEYLGNEKYDLIISHLCLNSIKDINIFLIAIKKYLHQEGLFVFSIPHPCFWHLYHSEWFNEFTYMQEQHLEVNLTITKDRNNLIEKVPYTHRPLSAYFHALELNKFSTCGFDEIYPEQDIQNLYGASWKNSRYCVFRARLL